MEAVGGYSLAVTSLDRTEILPLWGPQGAHMSALTRYIVHSQFYSSQRNLFPLSILGQR